jgi:GNAT superfamily N-acetyltransferase
VIVIRRAEVSDAGELTRIAHEAKRHWGYPDDWITQWTSALSVSDDYIAHHDVFVGEIDNKMAGFYALILENGLWQLDHLWVRPTSMGHGLGRRLFEHAVAHLHALAPGAVLGIEADPNAEAFYQHMGARRVGEVTRDWQGVRRVLPYLEFAAAGGDNVGHTNPTRPAPFSN